MMAAVLSTVAAKLLRSAADAAQRGGRIEPRHIWQVFIHTPLHVQFARVFVFVFVYLSCRTTPQQQSAERRGACALACQDLSCIHYL